MPINKRQRQVASEIRHILGEYFTREGKELTGHALVTVSRVEMSPDLQNARVYISIYDEAEKADAVLHSITDNTRNIRYYLAQRIRLRLVPELKIFKDDSMEYADRINQILRDLGE
jgi:ribosome-binding factor A